jgi:hypothetical protein
MLFNFKKQKIDHGNKNSHSNQKIKPAISSVNQKFTHVKKKKETTKNL